MARARLQRAPPLRADGGCVRGQGWAKRWTTRQGRTETAAAAASQRVRGSRTLASRTTPRAEANRSVEEPAGECHKPQPPTNRVLFVAVAQGTGENRSVRRSLAQAVSCPGLLPGLPPARPRPPAPSHAAGLGCGCSWRHRGVVGPLCEDGRSHHPGGLVGRGEVRGEAHHRGFANACPPGSVSAGRGGGLGGQNSGLYCD